MELTPQTTRKVARAFERRFGQSVMPLAYRPFSHPNGAYCVRVTDPETGTWAEYNVSWPRIRRMREFDAIAQGAA